MLYYSEISGTKTQPQEVKMKWLLIVIVMNAPIKTDLVFESLSECLSAETQMRKEWAELYNQAKKSSAEKETLGFLNSQMTRGTCIPSK
jgi:hypothetical protein